VPAQLALKYRPTTLDAVIGQPAVVDALRHAFTHGIPSAMLFSGNSGVGKTTLARITAARLKCELLEIDAASNSGIESMRALVERIRYRPLGKPYKVIIIDEVQAISVPAWQVLLLPLEEPPSWVRWLLCTTEPTKIPRTIRTRCQHLPLRPVTRAALLQHLASIAEREGLAVAPAVLEACAAEAKGSVRQALTNLETVRSCPQDVRAARRLLREPRQAERKNGTDLVALVRRGLTRKEMQDELGVDRTTLWRKLKPLIDDGVIREDDIRRG
jgi:DNA polymerase-3 subunit gamma/tau